MCPNKERNLNSASTCEHTEDSNNNKRNPFSYPVEGLGSIAEAFCMMGAINEGKIMIDSNYFPDNNGNKSPNSNQKINFPDDNNLLGEYTSRSNEVNLKNQYNNYFPNSRNKNINQNCIFKQEQHNLNNPNKKEILIEIIHRYQKNNEYYEGKGFIAAKKSHKDVLYKSLSHMSYNQCSVDSISELFFLNSKKCVVHRVLNK